MVSGLRDLDQCIVVGVAFGVRGEQQLGVSHDHGEQVVEVVSDAAGEAAEGIHLLRLAQLLLKLQTLLLGAPAFADVADVCGEERTARKLASADRDLHQEGVSVRSKPGHLFPVPRLGRAPAGQETGDRRPTRAPRLRQREQLADGLPDRRLLRVSKTGSTAGLLSMMRPSRPTVTMTSRAEPRIARWVAWLVLPPASGDLRG